MLLLKISHFDHVRTGSLRGEWYNIGYIRLIDFPDIETAKTLTNPEILRKVFKFIESEVPQKYTEGEIIDTENLPLLSISKGGNLDEIDQCTLAHFFILYDSSGNIQIVKTDRCRIHNLLEKRIISLHIYDTKEDVSKSIGIDKEDDLIAPFIYNKKIWATLPVVKDMESTLPMSTIGNIVESAIGVNTRDVPISNLGFLVQYNDCKPSTIEYVENFFEEHRHITHTSIVIANDSMRELLGDNYMLLLGDLKQIKLCSEILSDKK